MVKLQLHYSENSQANKVHVKCLVLDVAKKLKMKKTLTSTKKKPTQNAAFFCLHDIVAL